MTLGLSGWTHTGTIVRLVRDWLIAHLHQIFLWFQSKALMYQGAVWIAD